jgi:glutamine---fructose-6-phosphate transaminase (isomerizing)
VETSAAPHEKSTVRRVTGPLLHSELAEQPQVVERLLAAQRETVAEAALAARGVHAVLVAARGSSDNVARYAQHVFGRFCRLPVALASPSLATLYGAPPRLQRTLVIGISQSGQSPDVCAVVRDAHEQGQPTVAITNDVSSPLARAAATTIDIGAGAERSVAATKTYTASLAAVAALAAELTDTDSLREQLWEDLASVPDAMREQLVRGTGAAAEALAGVERCAVAGRGPNYASAFEAALKIKELCGIAAEPYSPADLMHGPLAVLGAATPLLAFAVTGPSLSSVLDAAAAAHARSADVVAIADEDAALGPACHRIPLVRTAEWLSPLVAILPAQALAARVARERGVDVDTPFGLAKVTRTV